MSTFFRGVRCPQDRNSVIPRIGETFEDCSPLGLAFALYFFSTGFDFLALAAGVSISRLVALFLLVICFLNAKKLRFEISPMGWVLFALMGAGLAALLMTSAPQTMLNSMFSFELGILIAFLALSLPFSDGDVKLCRGALLVSSLTLCVLMFASPGNVGKEWVSERVVVSIAGSQQDANEFCGYMIFAISFLTYYAVKRWRLWNFLFVGVILFCVMMTGSRGGLLANLASFFVAFGVALKQTNRKITWLLIGAFISVLILANIDAVLAMLPASVAQRFLGVSMNHGTALERTQAWKNVLDAYVSSDLLRQLLGHGYDATTEVTFNGLVAHNSYIEVLFNFGIVGFLLYLLSVIFVAVRTCRARRYVEIIALIGFGVLLLSLSAYYFKPFWAIVALALMRTKDWSRVEPAKARI